MKTDTITVVVEAADGRPLRYYSHEGKTFIESHEDRAYQIRVKNRSDERVKIVPVVDSINVISGQPGTDDPKEAGYVLAPHEEHVIKGFRVDNDQVAQFKFVKKEKSYATERGESQGNGVIAIRAYKEKESKHDKQMKELVKQIEELKNRPREKEYIWTSPMRPWYWEDYWYPYRSPRPYITWSSVEGSSLNDTWYSTTDNCISKDSCQIDHSTVLRAASVDHVSCNVVQSEAQPFDMGSGWGAAVKDSVKEVEFEVGKLIAEIVVYYASIEGLKALGIDVTRTKAVTFPEPFKRQFCARPSGWSG